MAKTTQIHAVELKRHSGPIMLPDSLPLAKAIEALQKRAQYEMEPVEFYEDIPCFVWDGALALKKALEEQFGEALQAKGTEFWGSPPIQVSIPDGVDSTVQVPWGNFHIAEIDTTLTCDTYRDNAGRMGFRVTTTTNHGSEAIIRRLFSRVREIALSESIYRGKAIQVKLRDAKGNAVTLPQPEFLRLSDAPVIFSRDLEKAIDTSILTPIKHSKAVKAAGIPLKRGVLLAGPYGTGKTLAAHMVAREAVANGWTFIYVPDINELSDALRFAEYFQPCIVFGEDIERVAGLERSDAANTILNTLDGIGSKSGEIMTILTSNHADRITEAMRRPGRIDVILAVNPPDADAVERLIRHYGRDMIDRTANLKMAASLLAGQNPATVRETVERSKLEAIRRSGSAGRVVSSDLEAAARVMITERGLFKAPEKVPHDMELVGMGIAKRIANTLRSVSSGAADQRSPALLQGMAEWREEMATNGHAEENGD